MQYNIYMYVRALQGMSALTALLLALSLLLYPVFARAQESTDTPAIITSTITSTSDTAAAAPTDASAVPDLSASSTPVMPQQADASSTSVATSDVQDATTTQTTADADALQSSSDPQATSTTETQTVVTDATSTDASSSDPTTPAPDTTVVVPDQDTQQNVTPIDPQPQLDVVAQALPAQIEATSSAPVTLSRDIDPQFVIAISGKTIPTVRKDDKSGGTQQTLTSPTQTSLEPDAKAINLSGSCTDAYFVVLLFKNQTDYDADPRSYILNKAFPCIQGHYSYSIGDLPNTLQNGTYYVLIGEEGDTGSWKPITSLTEITINRQ